MKTHEGATANRARRLPLHWINLMSHSKTVTRSTKSAKSVSEDGSDQQISLQKIIHKLGEHQHKIRLAQDRAVTKTFDRPKHEKNLKTLLLQTFNIPCNY